jgi:RNA polymerase sigma factor (sigma-70 family)
MSVMTAATDAAPAMGVPFVVVSDVDVSGFRDGDPDAIRAVYRAYGRLVFSVASRVLGDRTLAEEATQQTFVQAWQAAHTFDPSRQLGPWLATIARRVAIDVHRREALRAHTGLEDATLERSDVLTIPDAAASAYDAWEVRRAVDDLPPEEREVVQLQHLGGLTHNEIAVKLDIPVGTVKSRSARAYGRLATALADFRDGMA